MCKAKFINSISKNGFKRVNFQGRLVLFYAISQVDFFLYSVEKDRIDFRAKVWQEKFG